jgi:hypothetical protein
MPRLTYITFRGRRQTIAGWARELGFREATIAKRRRSGWSDEDALTVPVWSCQGPKRVGSVAVQLRVGPPLLAKLEAWAARQSDKPCLPEAMRRLADKAMGSTRCLMTFPIGSNAWRFSMRM